MQSTQLVNHLSSYQSLGDEQKSIVKLFALAYSYISLTSLGKALVRIGIDEAGKPLKPESLKVRLKPLLQAELLEENAKQGQVRCSRWLAEVVARELVTEAEFEFYLQALEIPTPIGAYFHRYLNAEECVRDARLAFYRADYAKVAAIVDMGKHTLSQLPALSELYLQWFINPIDLDWFTRHHADLLPQVAAIIGWHQQLYLYADPEQEQFLTQQLLLANGDSQLLLRLRVLELQLLRGDWAFVEQQLANPDQPELQALAATLALLKGNAELAVDQFEIALGLLRKQKGQRTAYFDGLAGVFYPLALLKINDNARQAKLTTLLNQAYKNLGLWSPIYAKLQQFQAYLQGDLQQRAHILRDDGDYVISSGFKPSGVPNTLRTAPLMQQVLSMLIKFWVKTENVNQVLPLSQKLYTHLRDNGFVWPAAELAKIFIAIEPRKALQWDAGFFNQDKQALADLFVSRADWELALDALSNLPKQDKKTDEAVVSERPTRLVWWLSYNDYSHTLKIEPREQKQQAKGKWTKGRLVALKRLHSERDEFDYLSENDHKLCDEIKEFRDHSWHGTTFEFCSNMPLALIGHPLLFWADTPEARVEMVQGQPELLVKKLANSDKIKISMEPMPSFEQKIYVCKETPTRLKVVEFTPEHHKICSVVTAKGLEVPLSAQERVLQTLTSISGLLTVHSDIGGSSSTAEQVSADATPRIHLLPMGEGLRVALLIRPLSTAGAYYQPGRGGESVLAEVDGKPVQAKRDLALEKQRAEQLLETCTELQQAQRDSSGEWLLEEPEQCLELLLQIQSLPEDAAILEWPEGVKFKLLGQTSGNGFSMQIKRDNDWFALQGELKVGEDTVIEIQQLLGLLNNQQGRFLQLKDGQFIALTDAFRRRLEDLKAYADLSGKKVRLNPLAALTLEDWQDDVGFSADEHWQAHLKRLQDARDYQPTVPSTFQAELRDYQQDGYNWLARLAEWGVGACLADDMGLGKTVQGLALLVQRAPQGPSLIVAPTSVCMNWENEAQRFAPTLKPQILGSGDRQAVMDKLGSYDLLICSYGLLQQESVAELLASIRFQTVILDEAQWIKNVATRRSQGAMNLQAEFKVIMTGTPLENHLGELWNLFRFINPGLLGSLEQFNQRFAGPIERDRNAQARQQLKKLIQPFILRRTKTQVLQELPPRTEIPVYIELSSEETAFYEALRRESLAVLTSNDAPPGQKQLQILAAITKLRRSCCNTNLVNPDLALPSSKLAAFGDIVDELLANQHKALVFSQFVDHLHLLEQYLQQRGVAYQYLDGSTPAKARQTRVDAFQRGEGELFLISLKAGGVGLNLTAADYVIHMDPWWNPAVEDQASDRAHRMGQQRPVTIYRMIAKNTIEEKIVALHGQKRDLADSLLDGADISGKMSADDLLSLMKG